MRDRIDISEVEAQTKIRAKYLRAIENEEWDLLPGPVYAKSFLRTYGEYLGLDSRMLVDEFRRRYEGPSDDFRPIATRPPRERDRYPRRRAPSWLPIAIVVVLVVVALGIVGTINNNSNTGNTSPPHPAARHNPARHSVTTHAVKPPPVPTKVTLHLVPTNLVYVCLVNGVGTKLINEQTFAPGQTIPTETGSKLLLTLGNNNVLMKVNGKAWPVAASPTAIRLMITPAGVTHIPSSQLPTCP